MERYNDEYSMVPSKFRNVVLIPIAKLMNRSFRRELITLTEGEVSLKRYIRNFIRFKKARRVYLFTGGGVVDEDMLLMMDATSKNMFIILIKLIGLKQKEIREIEVEIVIEERLREILRASQEISIAKIKELIARERNIQEADRVEIKSAEQTLRLCHELIVLIRQLRNKFEAHKDTPILAKRDNFARMRKALIPLTKEIINFSEQLFKIFQSEYRAAKGEIRSEKANLELDVTRLANRRV